MRSDIVVFGIIATIIIGITAGVAIQNYTFSTQTEATQVSNAQLPASTDGGMIILPVSPVDDQPTPTPLYQKIELTPKPTSALSPTPKPTRIPTLPQPTNAPTMSPSPTISTFQRPSFHPYTHESLLLEREGFGALTTGGNGENYYIVTTLNDDPENPIDGSLRKGLTLNKPATIIFSVDGTIFLESDITISSNKTLDGRGKSITITNAGLRIEGSENIILTNISTVNGKTANIDGPDKGKCNFPDSISGDALEVRSSKNIWIHRNTFSAYCDGLIDLVDGSHNITVSWNSLHDHNKTMLIGSGPSRETIDSNITATIHHNLFQNNIQRQPRVRFARVDMYNNFIRNWSRIAVAHSMKSQVILENNIFEAGDTKSANTSREGDDPLPGFLALRGDNLLLNGATLAAFESGKVFARPYSASIENASLDLKTKLEDLTGQQDNTFYKNKYSLSDENDGQNSTGSDFQNQADINHDGVVNTTDLVYCIDEYGTSAGKDILLLCDLDRNNKVDALDYSRVITELN